MDLIVSTPQGEAEISVNAVHESVTVGDLLQRVLNSPPPSLVHIDGRPTPIGTLISAAALVTGSVIEVGAPAEPSDDAAVTLVQVAGDGAGNRRPLKPGRYSLGTARRANVAPLTFNEVLVPRCEIVVDHGGQVNVAANQGDLDGRAINQPVRWKQQRLRIGHRVFRLDTDIADRATTLKPTPLGQLNFVRATREEEASRPEQNARTQGGRRKRRGRAAPVEVTQPSPTVPVDPEQAAFDAELENLRRTHLDLAEVIRRATDLSAHLWERRPTDDDAFVFSIGVADQRWTPDEGLDFDRGDLLTLPSAPVLVDLGNQRGIGFASTPPQARAAARALVMQACVTHSPDDLDVVVLTTQVGAARWEWIKWLPHARTSQGVQLLNDEESISDWVNAQRTLTTVVASIQSLGRPITPSRVTLAVVDDPSLWRGRAAMLRGLFAEAQLPVRFVAITDRADDVPAVCTTVVRIEANGSAEVDYPISGPTVTEVVPFVLEHDVAVAAARKLSPLEDNTVQQAPKPPLPPSVSLASLIDPDGFDVGRLIERWRSSRRTRRLRVVVGVGEAGPVALDLADDGPHALIVGAPRSGKSELLRTIVSSLIATNDPRAVNIVCVEPTHGSTFGVFAGVEHVVGYVDSFNEHAGVRLLRALQSEVARRARALAEQHAVNVGDHEEDAIARLVIVLDDASDVLSRYPAFLPQLIELADRSRHLGLHLIMATTQVPRSIEQSMKSYANIRVGLRMNDATDAAALMGGRDLAHVSMHTPGRGSVRLADGVAQPAQFASAAATSADLMEITPFILAREPNSAERKIVARTTDGDAELRRDGGMRRLVELVAEAAATQEGFEHQPVLCPDLPADLPYEQISSPRAHSSDGNGPAFAVSDLPDDHTQTARRWDPAHDGNVLLVGGTPAERASALVTLSLAITDRLAPDRLHLYVIDSTSGAFTRMSPFESLTACAAVATNDDPDRIVRVLSRIAEEVDARSARGLSASDPTVVLVVNDVSSLLRTLEPGGEHEQGRDLLERIVSSGPLNGITTVMSTVGEHAAPARLLGQFQQRIVLHLEDRGAYRTMGVEPGRIPPQIAGRAITLPDLVEIQIASVSDVGAAVAERLARADEPPGPDPVPSTPASVALAEFVDATRYDNHQWSLPVGLDARSLAPAALPLKRPGGALVLGNAGSGKSTMLANLARCALSAGAEVDIHAIASTWSPLLLLEGLTSATTLAGIDKWAAEFFDHTGRPRLVFVDDADRLEGDVFERLTAVEDPLQFVIAGGRTRELESSGHWTAPIRRSRAAVILRPLAGDGAMFGLHLRLLSSHPAIGRGLLIDDDVTTPVLVGAPPNVDDFDRGEEQS